MPDKDKGAGAAEAPQDAPQAPQFVAVYTASPTGVLLVSVPDDLVGWTAGAYVKDAIERGYWLKCSERGGPERSTLIERAQVIALQERGDNR